jgi:glyoxylase-like metal-dependent hydrolase (beta-lactamase superfamily II)
MDKKLFVIAIILFFPIHFTYGQEKRIEVSDKLELVQLSPETYVHISQGSNGMVTISKGEGIIVSTPPTDEATSELIKWVTDSLKVKITGVVIDSWHPDNMEGLDVFQSMHIKSYANEMTKKIAAEKGLPIPQVGFKGEMELKVGSKKLVLKYFGPAHTSDGIVVWIPEEKILFGNNGVRNYKGSIGNIGDANLGQWSGTIEKVRAEFGSARYVIPGHGNYGGPELLDYTINLYKRGLWAKILKENNVETGIVFRDFGKVFIAAQTDSVTDDKIHVVTNALVLADKGEQYVVLESDEVKFNEQNNDIQSNCGRIRIINKEVNFPLPEAEGYYKMLKVDFRDDAVGMTIILKELIQ